MQNPPEVPTEAGPIFTAPDQIAEPAIVAEAGVTTSEWQALVRYAWQLATVGTVSIVGFVITKLGLNINIPSEVLNAIVGFEFMGALAVITYIYGRSKRKVGTTA